MRRQMISAGVVFAALTAAAILAPARPAIAAAAYCPGGHGREIPRKVPAALAPAVAKTLSIDADQVRDASYVRCVGAKTMVCTVGANLSCGKAERRRSLPGASAFCRQSPGSDVVPMAATGHDTIYEWRCVGARAVAGKIVSPVDAQGYIAENWRELK
jgi:hypothetical protein